MTYPELIARAAEISSGCSLALAIYRQFGEKLFLIWIPKTDNKWVHMFWATEEKLVQTFELLAMNSQSRQAKTAQDFLQTAKEVLPDEVVSKVVEKSKQEALNK